MLEIRIRHASSFMVASTLFSPQKILLQNVILLTGMDCMCGCSRLPLVLCFTNLWNLAHLEHSPPLFCITYVLTTSQTPHFPALSPRLHHENHQKPPGHHFSSAAPFGRSWWARISHGFARKTRRGDNPRWRARRESEHRSPRNGGVFFGFFLLVSAIFLLVWRAFILVWTSLNIFPSDSGLKIFLMFWTVYFWFERFSFWFDGFSFLLDGTVETKNPTEQEASQRRDPFEGPWLHTLGAAHHEELPANLRKLWPVVVSTVLGETGPALCLGEKSSKNPKRNGFSLCLCEKIPLYNHKSLLFNFQFSFL